ncbi:MAG: lipocalin family protein [Chitinophagaceae bacterium]
MKKVLLGLLSLTLIVGTACKKSKDAPAFTKETVAGTYKLEKVTFKFGSSAESDITDGYVDECAQDDVVTLKADLTYQNVDAGQSCGFGDYSGSWSIPSSSKFEMDGDQYDLVSWNGTTLAVSEPFDFGGNEGTVILYMKKQ